MTGDQSEAVRRRARQSCASACAVLGMKSSSPAQNATQMRSRRRTAPSFAASCFDFGIGRALEGGEHSFASEGGAPFALRTDYEIMQEAPRSS